MKTHFYIIIIALCYCLTACASEKRRGQNEEKAQRFSGFYTITKIDGLEPLKKGVTFNIDNQKRRIYGFSGCNFYNAEFTLSKNMLNIVSPLSTKKACPPDNMSIEKSFFKSLKSSNRYSIKSGKLTLYDGETIILEATNTDF